MTFLNLKASVTATICLALASAAPLTAALAHEGHKMECKDSTIKAMKQDVQAMPDGNAKTTAVKEIKAAEDMMQKKDEKACTAHLQNAMEATEK